jgi:hypothetical protein
LSNPIKGLQPGLPSLRNEGLGPAMHVSYTLLKIYCDPWLFLAFETLIFLAKRFNTAYYLFLMNRRTSGHVLARQVDVLSRAVEISADGPGLQKFAPHFLYATANRGVFCFGAISPA